MVNEWQCWEDAAIDFVIGLFEILFWMARNGLAILQFAAGG